MTQKKTDKMISCAVTAAYFAFVICRFGIWYRTNDDAILANIAAGAYGPDRVHLVYVNILYGYMLRGLQLIGAGVNWFALSQVVLLYISTAVLTYYAIKHLGRMPGVLLSAAMMAAFGSSLLFRIQYTQTAALSICTGLVLLLENLGQKSRANACGLVLVLLGSMLRFDMFFAVGALSAAALLKGFLPLDKAGKKRALGMAAVMFCLVFGTRLLDRAIYKADPDWAAYLQYNAARTEFSDFKSNFLTDENTLADAGVTDAEFAQLKSWDFYDPENFPAERIEAICRAIPGYDIKETLSACKKELVNLAGQSYAVTLAAALLYGLFWALMGRRFVGVVWALGMTGAEIGFLCYRNRLPEWVEISLVVAMLIFLLAEPIRSVSPKERRKIGTAAAALVLAVTAAKAVPTYSGLADSARALQQLASAEDAYITAMAEDTEHLYLLSANKTTEINGYWVWNPRSDGFFSNIAALGGWYNGSPQYRQTLANYGVENPMTGCIDRADIYVDYHGIEQLCAYLSERTDSRISAVAEGDNPFAPYHIKTGS